MCGMFEHPAAGNQRQTGSRLSDRDHFAADPAQRNSRARSRSVRRDAAVAPARGNMPSGIVLRRAKQILDARSELAGDPQRDANPGLVCSRLNGTERLTRDVRARSEFNLSETPRIARPSYRFSRCHADRSYAILRAN